MRMGCAKFCSVNFTEWFQPLSAFVIHFPKKLCGVWQSLQTARVWCDDFNHERSEEHTSELQSPCNLVCRLLLEKKKREKQRRAIRSETRSRRRWPSSQQRRPTQRPPTTQ